MKYIVYGASESGRVFSEYVQAQNHMILATIDRNADIIKSSESFNNCIIVKSFSDLEPKIVEEAEEIVVAVGNPATAIDIAKELERKIGSKLKISTVHDEKYNFFYKPLIELSYIKNSSVLAKRGWYVSNQKKESVDIDSGPLPWYTYAAIDFLETKIHRGLSVFEYGCGNSTLWWASKVKEVFSVEDNSVWYQKIKSQKPSNSYIYCHKDLQKYVDCISEHNRKFDIAIIDGAERNHCAHAAIKSLKEDGVILWDNSDRRHNYKNGMDFLYKQEFKEIAFKGIGPINDYEWETSIFYKKNNIFGL